MKPLFQNIIKRQFLITALGFILTGSLLFGFDHFSTTLFPSSVKTIKSDKAYFYYSARGRQMPSYLIKGDKVKIELTSEGFAYVEYTNEQNTITKGWLNTEDLN